MKNGKVKKKSTKKQLNTKQAAFRDKVKVIKIPEVYPEEVIKRFPPVPFVTVCIKSVPGRRIWIKSPVYKVNKAVPGESTPRLHNQYKYLELWPEHYEII
jgi:hypothetical protein